MTEADRAKNSHEIIGTCKRLWFLGKKYWHPVVNLRMAQLSERLFRAYVAVSTKSSADTTEAERLNDYKMAAMTGESMISAYESRVRNDVQLAVYYCQLAILYEAMDASGDNVKKADEWYKKAVSVFKCNDDKENESLVESWRSKLSSSSSEKTSTGSSMNVIETMKL